MKSEVQEEGGKCAPQEEEDEENAILNESNKTSKEMKMCQQLKKSLRESSNRLFDDDLLHRTVADAGRWAYGIVAVDVWVLNDDRTILFRPKDAWWIDPIYEIPTEGGGGGEDAEKRPSALSRLTDSSREDYVPALPLYPGEGLPGALWSEAKALRRRHLVLSQTNDPFSTTAETGPKVFGNTVMRNRVIWRNIEHIANDPDQPFNPRLKLLIKLNLGYGAGVKFDFQGREGIVVFMSRRNVDLGLLQSKTNEDYILAASDLIGAAFALREPRHRIESERRLQLKECWGRVRDKLIALRRMKIPLEGYVEEQAQNKKKEDGRRYGMKMLAGDSKRVVKSLIDRMIIFPFRKFRGGGGLPPPVFSWREASYTFVCVLITSLVITNIQVALVNSLGSAYQLSLGPFGAFFTLLYGLTQAPASQPRNGLLGQTVALTIAISLSYTKAYIQPWLRASLSVALTASTMAKLGILHPPAGASAIIFSSGSYTWTNMVFMLVAYLVCILMAAFCNNVSDKRQYPTYWGIPMVDSRARRLAQEKGEKAKQL